MTPDIRGGLVERALEDVQTRLRLAQQTVARTEGGHGHQDERAEIVAMWHETSAERYEDAAGQAEWLAETCRIQAQHHRGMAATARGEKEEME